MGVDGCWCAPRSSKPVRGVKSLSGEFDPHMLPPEPRGRVPRGFLKNVDFPLDRTEGSSYNTTVRGVSRTISYPGVAQLVARMVRDHEAVSSNLATRTNEKACNCNGYRLFSCTFAGRFPFSFPFTGQKRCLTAQPPDTFSINFSMWSALLFFISSVTCP
mgnify:FL=1